MKQKNFTIISKYDALPLSCLIYEPKGKPKGIVQIVHGMCEYKARYLSFMEFLCKKGYVVECHDHRGHGDSVLKEADRGYFYDFKANAVVEDTVQITKYLREQYPKRPLTLFGHSMGSMIVRCYIQEHDDLIDKLVVCGSPSKNGLAGLAIGLTKTIRFFRGARHRSKMLNYLSVGKYDKRYPGEGRAAWLSENRDNVHAYAADPKCNFVFTCNGFENLFRLMKRTYAKKKYEVKNPDLPIHFVSGSDDAVMDNEKKWNESVELLRQVGYKQVTSKLYKGLRHEILNETDNDEPFLDLLHFIEK